jgi:tight adherence protein B
MMLLLLGLGLFGTLALGVFAFSGPSAGKATKRRLELIKERHAEGNLAANANAQIRKLFAKNQSGRVEGFFSTLVPKPAIMRQRLERTGKNITLGRYAMVSAGIVVLVAGGMLFKGAPVMLSLLFGLFLGIGLPHFVVSKMITRRLKSFNANFPDAIELMVRGLRSGLPITETLAIQRETGGNLAETLSNLADVLRKRAQMKLKIKAMSSEAKASAMIVGALPFIVFTLVYLLNPNYMGGFFVEQRLIVAGIGALVWMGIGVAIMAKMVNFEI